MQIVSIAGVATNNYGINVGTVTGGATGNYGVNVGLVTSVAAATNYGISVAGTTGAAVSSNNYGIKIASLASSGTGTANYGLNIVQPSGATATRRWKSEHPSLEPATGQSILPAPIQSYFAGNIGIGTSAPTSYLHVAATSAPTADMVTISNLGYGVTTNGIGALQVYYVGGAGNIEASSMRSDITPGGTSGSTWNAIRLVGGTAASGVNENAIKIENLTAGPGNEVALNIGTGWDFGVYSQTLAKNYFAGNVGIGTTNPIALLDVNGTSWLRGNGNVGIGTTSPGAKLDVNGAATIGLTTGGRATFSNWYGVSAFWIDMPTTGPGIGSGGAGTNPWIAYVQSGGIGLQIR